MPSYFRQVPNFEYVSRTNDAQITVADLTGVAVQDIQIAKVVLDNLE